MEYLPLCIKLKSKHCLIVGGGYTAAEKIENLIKVEAKITVVSPELGSQTQEFFDQGKLQWCKKEYELADLDDAFLVIAATGQIEHSREIFDYVSKRNRLVNAVDDPKHSNFIFAALLRNDPMQIAISSSGASPALAQKIREEIAAKILTDSVARLAKFLGSKRPLVKKSLPTYQTREVFWRAVIASKVAKLAKKGKLEKAEKYFNKILDQHRKKYS